MPHPPKMQLGARDVERVEQVRAGQKAEMLALREQVADLERKQESNRSLVEQFPGAMANIAALFDAVVELEKNKVGLTAEMVKIKSDLTNEMEKNKAESNAEVERNKAELTAEIELLKKEQSAFDVRLKARAASVQAFVKNPKPTTPVKASAGSWASTNRGDESPRSPRSPGNGPTRRYSAPTPEVEDKPGFFSGLASFFKFKDEYAEPDFDGCYLLFTEASGGAFMLQWSETELPENAVPLAYYKPANPVANHKYTSNGGKTELCRGVGGPNKKLFYQGWASFLRAAYAQKGTLTFLSNVAACPVAIFTCNSDTSVLRLEMGRPIVLDANISAMAVTPPLATGLDVQTMPTRMFQAVGEKAGAAFSLDGGGDGKVEDVAAAKAAMTLSRRSSAGSLGGSFYGGK